MMRKKRRELRCNSFERFIEVKCISTRINHMTNIGTRVRFADKHATTNFHKTSRFLQVPKVKKKKQRK